MVRSSRKDEAPDDADERELGFRRMVILFRRYDGPDLNGGTGALTDVSFGVLSRDTVGSCPEVDARTNLGIVAPGGMALKREGVEFGMSGLEDGERK